MSAEQKKLLIVDDGEAHTELAHALLRDYRYATRCALTIPCWECERCDGCELKHARDGLEAEAVLARQGDVDAILLDMNFEIPEERLVAAGDPALDGAPLERRRRLHGLTILRRLRRKHPRLPVILTTSREALALETDPSAYEADEMVALAGDASFDAQALRLLIERVTSRLPDGAEGDYRFGRSRSMQRLSADARALARTSLPILILGEAGTGKTALARDVIHPTSLRSGPFVSVDIAAIPAHLVAAELFGTSRGAFSGATDRVGRFEHASGGTLLLDEVGSLEGETQRLLLQCLQERSVTRLGENRARPVDVKLVAATNVDLEAAVRSGDFRPDLYARLNPVSRLILPPLRDRSEDLLELLPYFARRSLGRREERALLGRYLDLAGLGGRPKNTPPPVRLGARPETAPPQGVSFVLDDATLRALARHPWPGNLRELELWVMNIVAFVLDDAIHILESSPSRATPHLLPVPRKLALELLAGAWVPPRTRPGRTLEGLDIDPGEQLGDVARQLERQLYARLFRETGGDFERMAARLLLGDARANARRVRTRFNQLGLSARELHADDA